MPTLRELMFAASRELAEREQINLAFAAERVRDMPIEEAAELALAWEARVNPPPAEEPAPSPAAEPAPEPAAEPQGTEEPATP